MSTDKPVGATLITKYEAQQIGRANASGRTPVSRLLFGEGETGLIVYTILLRYWQWTPEEDVRPLIFLMSD